MHSESKEWRECMHKYWCITLSVASFLAALTPGSPSTASSSFLKAHWFTHTTQVKAPHLVTSIQPLFKLDRDAQSNWSRCSTSRHIDSAPLQIGSSLVRPSTTACNLSVIIDTHLTMEAQVMKTCRASNFHLSRINKIRRFLDFSSVKCVVNALVLSRLDYCNSLYLNLPSSLLNLLQRVQKAAVRTTFNLRKRDHVSIHRQSLRWLEIADRAKLKVA